MSTRGSYLHMLQGEWPQLEGPTQWGKDVPQAGLTNLEAHTMDSVSSGPSGRSSDLGTSQVRAGLGTSSTKPLYRSYRVVWVGVEHCEEAERCGCLQGIQLIFSQGDLGLGASSARTEETESWNQCSAFPLACWIHWFSPTTPHFQSINLLKTQMRPDALKMTCVTYHICFKAYSWSYPVAVTNPYLLPQ